MTGPLPFVQQSRNSPHHCSMALIKQHQVLLPLNKHFTLRNALDPTDPMLVLTTWVSMRRAPLLAFPRHTGRIICRLVSVYRGQYVRKSPRNSSFALQIGAKLHQQAVEQPVFCATGGCKSASLAGSLPTLGACTRTGRPGENVCGQGRRPKPVLIRAQSGCCLHYLPTGPSIGLVLGIGPMRGMPPIDPDLAPVTHMVADPL